MLFQRLFTLLGLAGIVLCSLIQGSVLDYDKHGAVCGLVKQDDSSAYVSLYIDEIQGSDPAVFKDMKVPVLIFRYLHAANFSNIPAIEDYIKSYSLGTELPVDLTNEGFDLKLAQDYKEIDENKLYNGYVVSAENEKSDPDHVDVKFVVPESGIYCVYIAPPTNAGLQKLEVPVKFYNSYGNLPYLKYMVYSQLKYAILLGVVITGVLVHAILKYKVGPDFKNLNNVSLISKGVILFIHVPTVTFYAIQWLNMALENRFSPSDNPSVFLRFTFFLTTVCAYLIGLLRAYLTFLFAMGYGVIYYHESSSRNYRIFPSKFMGSANKLLFVSILIMLIALTVQSLGEQYPIVYGDSMLTLEISESLPETKSLFNSLSKIFVPLLGIILIVWPVLTFVYYFKTKKTIGSFAPVNSEGSSEANEKIIKSFRRSILIVFFLPLLLSVVFMVFYGRKIYLVFENSGYTTGSSRVIDSFVKFETEELLYFKLTTSVFLSLIWLDIASTYLTVLAVYAIWIKDNNGLLIENELYSFADFEIPDETSK